MMFDEHYVDGIHYFSKDFDEFDWIAFESFKKEVELDEEMVGDIDTLKTIELYSYICGFNAGRKYRIAESN